MTTLRHLDLTLPSPEANLACDEALLEWAEAGAAPGILRFWEPTSHFVVVGYANRVAAEVNTVACRARHMPILRRCTGGGAVLQGPGCLNYSLVLPIGTEEPLRSVVGTNRFVMERHRQALSAVLGRQVLVQGATDLTLGPMKFSGNAQRRKRQAVLFHGTMLLALDLGLMEEVLLPPSKKPAYRLDRPHRDFVTSLMVPASLVKTALLQAWQASLPQDTVPHDAVEALVASRYSREEWNLKW